MVLTMVATTVVLTAELLVAWMVELTVEMLEIPRDVRMGSGMVE